MLYVTGDLHGDMSRMREPDLKRLKKDDALLVCGDFGFVWDGSAAEQKQLHKLAKSRYQLLFCEGTHDNLDLLAQYPQVEFAGGSARHLGGNLYYLQRGQIYLLQNKRIFVFGGGETSDLDGRQQGVNWWEQEMPDEAQLQQTRQRLAECDYTFDYAITHECCGQLKRFLQVQQQNPEERLNRLNCFFDELVARATFSHWYFGCYHIDRDLSPTQTAVYRQLLPLK